MRLTKLAQSVKNAKIIYNGRNAEREIEALCADSRQTGKDSLFFCLKGGNSDGHNYAAEAVKKGAIAIVTERELALDVPQILVDDTRFAMGMLSAAFYGYPAKKLKLIGITGTNGKTTTSYMLAGILEKAGKRTGVIGTLGVKFGSVYLPTDLTTPDPIYLQKTLAMLLSRGAEYVVMEISAHALWFRKIAGLCFTACIFTNLSQDHLDFFADMQEYKAAKSLLFNSEICPIAVLNGDDCTGREFGDKRKGIEGSKTVYYGLETPSDAFAIVTDESLFASECLLNINDRLCRVSLRLTGRHNVYNALAAAACAMELGISSESVSAGLSALKGVNGRLQNVSSYRGAEIFVDFAHTPDGLQKSLDAIKEHCKGRVICLFGCGGNRDKSKRPMMGETAAKRSDFTVLTSDNPRYEDPLDIIGDIEKGYRRFSMKYVIVPDRKRAIEYALDMLKKGDVLLVAGKGGEEYQEIMGIKYSFNDNDIIEKIIKEKEIGR